MLRTEHLSYDYPGGAGVGDVSFHVAPGEIVALVGLNGSGKTTLMRLALGMLRPKTGKITIFGTELASMPRNNWAKVGFLIETPLAYPELTVQENLTIAAWLRKADPALVDLAIAMWELSPYQTKRFRQLSLGYRQRVGLAIALQHNPKLIVLDEPSNALDPATIVLLREQLQHHAQQQASIVVSSHHLDEVARIADRVLLMNAGRMIGELDTSGVDLERRFFKRIQQDDQQRKLS